ncbi:hypothetical protein CEXT_580841 [Caerostris extrusa]|uniref:Uncharacterized protein n=1 Tax=Caerostris extrusa TaxID=172846 RepID=A0AAV4V199_CAEEX|nr:hypothetical protein CEXT_580841 [Caerostris extrusa]
MKIEFECCKKSALCWCIKKSEEKFELLGFEKTMRESSCLRRIDCQRKFLMCQQRDKSMLLSGAEPLLEWIVETGSVLSFRLLMSILPFLQNEGITIGRDKWLYCYSYYSGMHFNTISTEL